MLFSVISLVWVPPVYAKPQIRVAFLVPEPEGGVFWGKEVQVMRAAADDLGIDLQVTYSLSTNRAMRKNGLKLLAQEEKPDYFLTGYYPESTKHHLEFAEQRGIYTLLLLSGVITEDREQIGRARGRYQYWIGEIIPDDQKAGFDLADMLIQRIRISGKLMSSEKAPFLAVGGYGDTMVDSSRLAGLSKRIRSSDDSVLVKFAPADWSKEIAQKRVARMLRTYPEARAIWCASDTMALGAIDAVEDAGKVPGRDIFIGGIDATSEALEAVKSGKMSVTFGGHFLDGAWALILIHDYHNNIDFAETQGIEISTILTPITTNTAQHYKDDLTKVDWDKIDFRQFSKVYSPGTKYNFSFEGFLERLNSRSKSK